MSDRIEETSASERAALEELQRLHEQILRYRAERKAATEQFERFVQSFRTGGEQFVGEQPVTEAVTAKPADRDLAQPRVTTGQPAAPVIEPAAAVDSAAATSPSPSLWGNRQVRAAALIAAAATVLAVVSLLIWSTRPRPPAAAEDQSVPSLAAPSTAAVEPARQVPVAPESALTTNRAVWVRVFADGQRVLERELPRNARVPLRAEKTVVIRTGDAGAIRLTLRGRDFGALGRDGEVVTRTFNVPPAAGGR